MANCHNKDGNLSSAAFMKQLWLTDCKSLEETLPNPKCNAHSDKRLSIEIVALRQGLWLKNGQSSGDPVYEGDRPNEEELTDQIRCIDTDTMTVDPMTKAMDPAKLLTAMETNVRDVEQPLDSIIKKHAK